MSIITKERALQIFLGNGPEPTASEERELARIALASLEAEAVAFVMADDMKDSSIISTPAYRDLGEAMERTVGDVVALYAAPPAPVSVPDERPSLNNGIVGFDEGWNACRAAMLQCADGKPELTVWYGSMPESNGKANWTAILHRKGEGRCMDGFTIDRSEYPGRVLYAADRVRYLIGEKSERPSILDYDADAHSGYVKPGNSPVIPDGWVLAPVDMTPEQIRAVQLNSELGAYAAANLTGAYSLFREFWDVAIAAAPQQEVKP